MEIDNDLKYLAETDEIFAQESGHLDFLNAEFASLVPGEVK